MPKTQTQRITESQTRRRIAEKEERVRLAEEARTGLPFHRWGPKHYTIRPGEPWREIRYLMDMARVILHPKGPKTVVLLKSAQLGYSILLAAVHAYLVAEENKRVVFALPTDTEAGRFFRNYINGIFQRVEQLRLLVDAQPDVTAMRGRHRVFAQGGSSLVQGAGVEDRFASFSADAVVLDEVDRYPVLSEGDSLTLSKRAVRNTGGVVVAGSTPTSAHGPSQIVAAYKAADVQFVFAIRCPGCKKHEDLVWENLHWDECGDPDERGASTRYGCSQCGLLWDFPKLKRAIAGGAWIEGAYQGEDLFPTRIENGMRVSKAGDLLGPKGGKRKWPKTAGFALMGLNSQWFSWPEAVAEWLKAQGDPARLRVFVETYLAREWMEEGDRVEAGAVRKMALAEPPDDHRLGILAVDVQDQWLSCASYLFGPAERCVLVDRREFNGTVDRIDGAAWVELSRWLATKPTWNGYPLRAMAIDTGFCSDMAVRNSQRLKFDGARLLVKGVGGFAAPTWKRGKTAVRGVRHRLYLVGSDGLKMSVIQRYASGHFRVVDTITDEIISELESEELVWSKHLGRRRRRWQQVADRNELIDQTAYALAAARIINMSDDAIAGLSKAPVRKRRRKRFVTE